MLIPIKKLLLENNFGLQGNLASVLGESFKKYGNGMTLEDWRRSNVNEFVKCISLSIKNIKPWVQFGISPFGVASGHNQRVQASAQRA